MVMTSFVRGGARHKTSRAPAADRLAQLASTVVFIAGFGALGIGAGQAGGGSTLRQLLWLGICLVAVVLSLRESYAVQFMVPRWQTIVLFLPLLYAGASYAWSYDPPTTLRRVVLFAVLILVAFVVFARARGAQRDLLHVLNRPVALLVLTSLAVTAAFPGYAITEIGWRGVASHKNEFGQLAAIGTLLGVAAIVAGRRTHGMIAAVVCVALLGLSRSMTSAISLVAALLLIGGGAALAGLSGRSSAFKIVALSTLMLCAALVHAVVVLDLVPHPLDLVQKAFGAVGKSTTLTGRTELWELVLLNSRFHDPWTGGGYGSFWTGLTGAAGYISWRFPGGYVGSAHNGYIDVLNELGYLGLGILCLFTITQVWMLARARHLSRAERFFHWAVIVFALIVNTSESSLWRGTSFLNIVMLMSYCRLLGLVDAGSTTRRRPALFASTRPSV
jgi:exopolysaccharide production protein ExoQ